MSHPGRELLRVVKAAASGTEPTLSLPIGEPVVGLMRPVATRPERISRDDVRLLTEWRNRFRGAFLTDFVATEERTARWLAETVGPDDSRILFMIDDLQGATIGHIGLASIDWDSGGAEADAVVRGRQGQPGVLTQALRTMWRWGSQALALAELSVRVRSDNPAIAFYEKVGFREAYRVPLRAERVADGINLVEQPGLEGAEVSLVHMRLEVNGG